VELLQKLQKRLILQEKELLQFYFNMELQQFFFIFTSEKYKN